MGPYVGPKGGPQWLAAKEGGGSATVQASVADLLKGLGLRV